MWSMCTFRLTIFNVCVVWISYTPYKQCTGCHKNIKTETHVWTCYWHTTKLILLPQEDECCDMTEDNKQHRVNKSSFCSPLWPPSHRWHSHAPPSPTQTPNAAFLFSATEQKEVQKYTQLRQTQVKMAECSEFEVQEVSEEMWALSLRWVFQEDEHFPAPLHQLVSQSPAPELWLSGSSNERETRRMMQWKGAHSAIIYQLSDLVFDLGVVSC